MKISKIPGLGSYGHYIDDVDFDHLTDEEWIEIGKFHLKDLVTILRNVKISKDQFYTHIPKFGPLKSNIRARLMKKYGSFMDANKIDIESIEDEEDRFYLSQKKYLLEPTENGNYLTRVSGKRDENGNMLGIFSSGDLGWHSNESGTLTFSPGVALLGGEYMRDSATCFMQTVDVYQSFTESFRSELDEMVILHRYIPGKINAEELTDQRTVINVRAGFCPVDNSEVPLVIYSPGGIKSLHYPVNSAASIKGLSEEESNKIFKILNDALFSESNVYNHWYQNDNDLLLFDNSITLHSRIGGHPDRVVYRIQYDYSNLLDSPWYPYFQPKFAEQYKIQVHEMAQALNLKEFKLP